MGPEGRGSRVVVATHPKGPLKSRVGTTRKGIIYELFFTKLPQEAFTAADIVALYLHRGASGTSAWNWVMCLSRLRCARPSLLPPSQRPELRRHLCRAMASLRSPCAGSRVVSPGRTSSSSPTGCCIVRLVRRCVQPSSKALPMAVCACSTAPGYSIVAAAQSVCSVSGTGKPPRDRVGSVYCCILSGLVPRRCGYAGLEPEMSGQ